MCLWDEEQFHERGNPGSPPRLDGITYTTLKRSLEEKRERDLLHVQTQHETVVVFSKLFNLFTSQLKREGPCQIEWLTFMASGYSSQTEMSTSALINYSSLREVKFLPLVADAPVSETTASGPCSQIQILARSFVFCRDPPPQPKKNVLLTPVLSQPETRQVVTVQRRAIHSKHTTGSVDCKSQ